MSGHRKNRFGDHHGRSNTPISLFRSIVVAICVTALILLIVAISSPLASAQSNQLSKFGNFVAVDPPRRPADIPFAIERDGKIVRTSLAALAGRVVVLNFWATWCGPCVREMPSLDRLHGGRGTHGIEVVPISTDRGGVPVVRRFYEARKIKHLPIVIDQDRALMAEFNIMGLPTTIILDARGREVGRVLGAAEWDSREIIARLRGFAPNGAKGSANHLTKAAYSR